MKVRYIKEGYFKNPAQAKIAREKEKTLSNADKISGVYNDMYNSAKVRVLTRELTDYFTNYGNEYNSEEWWRNVSYCWYLSPFFNNCNCADNDTIPGFNSSLRVEYSIETEGDEKRGDIIVTPRYSFKLPEEYKTKFLSCSLLSGGTKFEIRRNEYETIDKSKMNVDMTVKIQTSIGEKLAKQSGKDMTIETVVMKDLQRFQFKLGRVIMFDKMPDEEVEICMRVSYPDIMYDSKARGEGFIPMIENALDKFLFKCKGLNLTFEDMGGITHGQGSAYVKNSTPEVKESLKYATMIKDFNIDTYKLFEFLCKYQCISSAGGVEHAMKFYQRKYLRSSVEVFYRRYYKFVIENNKIVDIVYGSLLPTTSHPEFLHNRTSSGSEYKELTPDVTPVSVEFYGVEMIYVYSGNGNLKIHKIYGYIDSNYIILDKTKLTEDDSLVVGWLNKIGERIAKIMESI